jgi:hypothetical protein
MAFLSLLKILKKVAGEVIFIIILILNTISFEKAGILISSW